MSDANVAVISAVNWAETLTKVAEVGQPPDDVAERLTLSLGDRSCLALAQRLDLSAVTTDRAWTRLGDHIGVAIRLARA